MRLIFLAAFLLNIFVASAQAEQRIALVIGNSAYAGSPVVAGAVDNARAVASTLRGLGFDVTELVDAGREEMLAARRSFRGRLAEDSSAVGLFYYCGYAVQAEGSNFLLPADFGFTPRMASIPHLTLSGVWLGELLSGLNGAGALRIVLLDTVAPAADPADLSPGLARIAPAEGMIVMLSAQPGSAAFDGPAAGNAFTDALVRRLVEPGAAIETILGKVRDDVIAATQSRQLPDIVIVPGSIAGFVPIAPTGPTALPSIEEDLATDIQPPVPPAGPDLDAPSGGGGSFDGGSLPELPKPDVALDYQPPDLLSPDGDLSDTSPDEAALPEMPAPDPGWSGDFPGGAPGDAFPLDDAGPGGGGGGGTGDVEPVYPDAPKTEEEIAPGGGGNSYADLVLLPEAEAWAAVADSDDPLALQMFVDYFPSSRYAALASRRIAQLSPAMAEPPSVEPSGPAPPPPTPTAAPDGPAAPAAIEIVRHPMLDAPDEAVAGEEFTVSVALTEDQVTPDVTVRAGPESSVTAEGALEFALPATSEEWPIDIDLLAAGFDLTDGGKWSRRVTLFRGGDSDFARFTIKPRDIRETSRPRQLIARLYHEGRFLGSVSRPVTVLRDGPAMGGAVADEPPAAAAAAPASETLLLAAAPNEPALPALKTDIVIGDEARDVPDLDVTIHYSDPDRLGDGLIIIHSPHIGAPVSAVFTTPEGMGEWLDTGYLRLVKLGLQLRGARPLNGGEPAGSKQFITKVAEGFGSDLYRRYVPDAFKQVFWSLKAEGKLHSIQLTSNSPMLPWELVRPETADGEPDGFLGIDYRFARWAPRSTAGQIDRPLNRLPFTGVAAVAPAYENSLELPFQKVEVDALRKLAGFRLVGGDFSSFEKMVGEVSTGFIHFSGHGEVNDPGTGAPVFAIRLLDQALDPTTWRALTFAPHDKGNPFFFFNACDSGQARSLGGFVQGWGPAILESGASGFIGGMWPLTDQTAASFSTSFYGGISGDLQDGPVYLAAVLQDVRRKFYETGDPTYLAYTFYGNANLQIVSALPSPR